METIPAWDKLYREGAHLSIWPWSDLVSYVKRYFHPKSESFRVLELGCGPGANIPFFKYLDAAYYAIEGSPAIVSLLKEKYPEYAATIVQGDFTKEIPFGLQFDLIVDRASLTHNATPEIKKCLGLVHKHLAGDGMFIGIDWFSTEHSDYRLGEAADEPYTRKNISIGQFSGVGKVHFSDKQHLLSLFEGFEITRLEHKIIEREIPEDKHRFASWNLVAVKKQTL
jgi:SAM-dependent methyltransferase